MSIYGNLVNEGFFSDRKKKKETKDAVENAMEFLKKVLLKSLNQLSYANELSIWLFYHDINKTSFNKIVEKEYKDKIETNKISEDGFFKDNDGVDYIKKFDNYGKYVFLYYEEEPIIYFINKGIFLLHDSTKIISENNSSMISYDNMISLFKDKKYYPKYEDLVEADKRLGYYKLSTPPEGVTPKPVPNYKK